MEVRGPRVEGRGSCLPPLLSFLFLLSSLGAPSSCLSAPLLWAPEPDQLFRVPEGWRSEGRVAPSHPLGLTFALRQRNRDRLEALVAELSSPRSTHYGKRPPPSRGGMVGLAVLGPGLA
uniref:Peptidase S53 activation domain-containing protein n=1 Tax=Anolis carolinensis TaxID=28377 RepID=A0A803SMK6_ANOCA